MTSIGVSNLGRFKTNNYKQTILNSKMGCMMETEKFQGNYFQWLKKEIVNINIVPLTMLIFIAGFQIGMFLVSPINWLTVVALLATIIGCACTVYMADGSTLNGWLGLISAVGFIAINIQAKHYANVLDQLIFVLLIDLPLIVKWRTWGENIEKKVKIIKAKSYLWIVPIMLLSWVAFYYVDTLLGSNSPLWDSATLTIGATASIMVVLHFNASYKLWFLSDIVNLGLWVSALSAGYSQASLPMLVSMSFYFATTIYGMFFSVWSSKKN